MTPRPTVRRARAAFWWVGVIVPLALLALAAAVVLSWLPDLPDPVAMHWSGQGPDGFGPRWTVFVPLLVAAAIVAGFAALALFAHRMPSSSPSGGGVADARRTPQWSMTARLLGATSLGSAGLMALVTIAGAGAQRGLADAADAADITGSVLLGLAVLVALAVVGWFLQPRVEPAAAAGREAVPVELAATERAAWFGTVSIARRGAVALGVLWLVLASVAAFALASGEAGDGSAGGWILAAAAVVLLVVIGGSLVFRVRVSPSGLRVRSALGWPDTRIGLNEIDKVEVVAVNPLAEFGGWGWRLAVDGRRGVVLRRGEALQIVQRSGRVFVVTVDGAAEAAAVLAGLRAAQAPRQERP